MTYVDANDDIKAGSVPETSNDHTDVGNIRLCSLKPIRSKSDFVLTYSRICQDDSVIDVLKRQATRQKTNLKKRSQSVSSSVVSKTQPYWYEAVA